MEGPVGDGDRKDKMPVPIRTLMMPMTRKYTLILIETIAVTLHRPPMVKRDLKDLNCIIMKANLVINPELRHPKKNKMMKAKQVINFLVMVKLVINPELRHPKKTKMMDFNKIHLLEMKVKQVINYLERMIIMAITIMVTGPFRCHPIFPPNLTQRTSTRYLVSPRMLLWRRSRERTEILPKHTILIVFHLI